MSFNCKQAYATQIHVLSINQNLQNSTAHIYNFTQHLSTTPSTTATLQWAQKHEERHTHRVQNILECASFINHGFQTHSHQMMQQLRPGQLRETFVDHPDLTNIVMFILLLEAGRYFS